MIPSEMVEQYFRKSGDSKLLPGMVLTDDHGFLVYTLCDDFLLILHMFGDGKYWIARAEEIARQHGKKELRGGTVRNPFAMARATGFKLAGFILSKEVK